jgi:hypothetical protein
MRYPTTIRMKDPRSVTREGRHERPAEKPGWGTVCSQEPKVGRWRLRRYSIKGREKTRAGKTGLIDVLLVSALLLEVGHEGDRIVDAARPMRGHEVDQYALHVLAHGDRAANIDMRAIGDP